MLKKAKEALFNLISSLGYNCTDNGAYEEIFPWLMLRTNNHKREESFDCRTDIIVLTVDIFSTYSGEQEIIDIVDNISNHIWDLREALPELQYVQQSSLHILDDKAKGPVRKHGVVSYQLLLTTGEQKPAEEDEDGTTGD